MESNGENVIGWSSEASSFLSNHRNLDAAANSIINDLVDSLSLGIVFEVHRAAKMGFFDREDTITEEANNFYIVDEESVDIFGQKQLKKIMTPKCICPSCNRNLGAQVFAPHLAKCMGMGRNSARLASQRISSITQETMEKMDYHTSNKPRKKRDLNSKKSYKSQKTGKIEENETGSWNSESMDMDVGDGNATQAFAAPMGRQVSNMSFSGDVSQEYGETCEENLQMYSYSPTSIKQDYSITSSGDWVSAKTSVQEERCSVLKMKDVPRYL
ncbi:SAGA-associated factor 11 homolog [Gryllus bimaculatus]|nr:SAGA-associated factor 11 homolog [Gryllus bimaculatus]